MAIPKFPYVLAVFVSQKRLVRFRVVRTAITAYAVEESHGSDAMGSPLWKAPRGTTDTDMFDMLLGAVQTAADAHDANNEHPVAIELLR